MIGYVTHWTNDLERVALYCDPLFGVRNVERAAERDNVITGAKSPDQPMRDAIRPDDGNLATVGNGVMVALMTESREQVDDVDHKAVGLGSPSEAKANPEKAALAFMRRISGISTEMCLRCTGSVGRRPLFEYEWLRPWMRPLGQRVQVRVPTVAPLESARTLIHDLDVRVHHLLF